MKSLVARWMVIAACVVAGPRWTHGQDFHELKVRLAQANNNSPYSFVRAKSEPGEVSDRWAVRFFDEKGAEIPYFVWDSVRPGDLRLLLTELADPGGRAVYSRLRDLSAAGNDELLARPDDQRSRLSW